MSLIDLFTEASTANLGAHSPDTGAAWDGGQIGGANEPQVIGGAGVVRFTHQDSHVVTNAATFSGPDYRVRITATPAPSGTSHSLIRIGVVARADSNNWGALTAYAAYVGSTGFWSVRRLNAGAATVLAEATSDIPGFIAGDPHEIYIDLQNNGADVDWAFVVDGTTIASGTDTGGSVIQTAGRAGIYAYSFNDGTPEVDAIDAGPPTAPEWDVVPDQADTEGDSVNVDFSQYESIGTADQFAVQAGSLPGGLSLDAGTGVVTGTVDADIAGTFSVTLRATNTGTAEYDDVTFDWTISAPVPTAPSWGTIPDQVSANGDTVNLDIGSYETAGNADSFSIQAGSLPAGLSMNTSTGVVTGTITAESTGTITIRAANTATGETADASFYWTVNAAGGGGGAGTAVRFVNGTPDKRLYAADDSLLNLSNVEYKVWRGVSGQALGNPLLDNVTGAIVDGVMTIDTTGTALQAGDTAVVLLFHPASNRVDVYVRTVETT